MNAPASRLKLWHCLALILATLFCLVPGIASLPPIDRDEARFVQASKQMLETGDYIDIKLQDEHRYKKPIGIYWLQTAAVILAGGDATSEIWRYRLVSVASGMASVLLIALLGTRLFGAKAGLAAGIMLAGLLGLAFEGRIAKTDGALLAVTLLAQTALAYIYLAQKDRVQLRPWWPYLFWVAIGIGVLIKGPLTLLIAALTTAGVVFFDKDRSWLKSLKPWAGLAIVILISAPWLVAITLKSDGAFWNESVAKDMLGKISSAQESHWGPLGFYVLMHSLYVWPFGYLAILGGVKALNKWREPRILFCFAWHLPFLLIMELLPTKLPHYLLPVYPPLLLLAGWGMFGQGKETALLNWQKWLSWLAAFGLAVVTFALAVIAIAIVPFFEGKIIWAGIIASGAALLAGWFASGLSKMNPELPRLMTASLAAVVFYSLTFASILPAVDTLWISRSVAELLSTIKSCGSPNLASSSFHEPSLVFLTKTDTKLTDLQGLVTHLNSGGGCAFALVPVEQVAELQALIGAGKPLEKIGEVSGINYSKGAETSLALLRLVR